MSDRRMSVARAHRLDAPERLLWLPPVEVVNALALKQGDFIADIGAGTGYFSLPMAQAVIPGGRVFAIDVQREMLELFKDKLDQYPAFNVELVQADASGTGLADATCDVVFMANVWHEFEDRGAVLRESIRILKPLGRIAVLDWRPDVEPEHGPPLEHRLPSEEGATRMAEAGFERIVRTNIGRYSWIVQANLPKSLL